MTVGTMLIGLVPLLWADGSGADVMKRIAAPMVGGLVTSAFLTLEIIPVIYTYWRNEQLVHERLEAAAPALLAELQRFIRIMQAGAAALVASLALRLYVDGFEGWLMVAHVAGAGALGLSALTYLWARRRALHAVELSSIKENEAHAR
jgi:Cu(I)/Ag(I) efflux system membrane protein CusA/SilA